MLFGLFGNGGAPVCRFGIGGGGPIGALAGKAGGRRGGGGGPLGALAGKAGGLRRAGLSFAFSFETGGNGGGGCLGAGISSCISS